MKIRGWVYVLSNEAMLGLLKVGYSTKDPKLRSAELNGTGLPYDFVVEYDVLIENPRDIEQLVHRELSSFHEKKEFFRTTISTVVRAIRKVAGATGSEILLESRSEAVDSALESSSANAFNSTVSFSSRAGVSQSISATEQFLSVGGKPTDITSLKKQSELILKTLENNGWSVGHDGFKWTIKKGETCHVAYTRQDLVRLGVNPTEG